MPHPMLKRELCGADALATIQRDEFGMAAGKDYGFSMEVTLRIQVEAIAQEATAASQSPVRSPSPACGRGVGVRGRQVVAYLAYQLSDEKPNPHPALPPSPPVGHAPCRRKGGTDA